MRADDRVFIFIDGNNLYHGMRTDFGRTDLNFEIFADMLCGERRLVRVHYYNAPISENQYPVQFQTQQRFFDRLRETPYFRVILGRLEPREGTFVEKGTDIRLSVDMLTLAMRNVYDTAILVTGDSDFASLAEAVQDLGKHVENVACPSTTSTRLRHICDRATILSAEFMEPCWL